MFQKLRVVSCTLCMVNILPTLLSSKNHFIHPYTPMVVLSEFKTTTNSALLSPLQKHYYHSIAAYGLQTYLPTMYSLTYGQLEPNPLMLLHTVPAKETNQHPTHISIRFPPVYSKQQFMLHEILRNTLSLTDCDVTLWNLMTRQFGYSP